MKDIIHLLPDTVANQIAAGEVIQRPASAVKELLENAVDAGSTNIELFIKDSGKTLIRIVDNGSGMTPSDARMAFARHATSKITSADDLFAIKTMGFRGEAMASIAAIAQVELKTMKDGEEIGTVIEIEGNEFKNQQPVGMPAGTTISVKNLFFNVPARRNFLKSNSIEARHILEEFERVALPHPEIAFNLNLNGTEQFRLPISNLRQRIVNIYGNPYNERLVPIQEETSLITIHGFVGKPEFARKTRGEQFFFVNRRFIIDGYLHHAVTNAFEELLPRDSFASYWLFIEIDPSKIDVNIHPTKTEIKFEDERSVYAIVRAAVKRSLGQYSVSPAIDFDQETTFDLPHSMRFKPVVQPGVTVNTDYNPFQRDNKSVSQAGWQKVYEDIRSTEVVAKPQTFELDVPSEDNTISSFTAFQSGPFLITRTQDGILVLDSTAIHERIIYNRLLNNLKNAQSSTQQLLFPINVQLTAADFQLLKDIENEIRALGFDMREFGLNTYVIHGTPPGIPEGRERDVLEDILEQYKHHANTLSSGIEEKIAFSMARSMAFKKGQSLSDPEIQTLLREFFEGNKSDRGIDGKPCMRLLKTTDLSDLLK
jgi:DNA mismatch repair protein MutL